MRDGFAIFDTHVHIGDALHSGREHRASRLLAEMDRYGIDRSLAIPFPLVNSYREAHDEIGKAVHDHPNRFSGAACLNPYLPLPEFRDEVRRCREQYGFCALKLQPQFQPLDPSSARSDFLFETALENKMAVVCHTGSGIPYALPSLFMLPARKFPTLNFVLAHCGGGGMLLQEAIVAALFCPNIYLELSTLMPNHVAHVLAQVAAERLMIGSDLPENIDVEIGKIVHLAASESVKRAILWETASRVFGLGGNQ